MNQLKLDPSPIPVADTDADAKAPVVTNAKKGAGKRSRILIVLGHPSNDSLCASLAERYAESARSAGKETRLLRLSDLQFDPILWQGYRGNQPLEPDLQAAQAAVTWADHLVFVYPLWWGAMPALLKGFIDRVFLPGYAFKYRKNSSLWDKLLAGRSAQLIVTMDSPPWYFKWVNRMPGHQQMKKTILQFSGITPVRITSFGPVRSASESQRNAWLTKVERLALTA